MKLSRRDTLIGALFAALASGIAHAAPLRRDQAGRAVPGPLRLWYDAPAGEWVEALPIGNGRLGAMVFGGVGEEGFQLNEDTLWSGGPYTPDNPEALAALPEVRRLIFAGRYDEAEAIAQSKIMARPLRQMVYQPLGYLRLAFPGIGETTEYRRELDLDTALASVAFQGGGVRYRREAFVSPVDQVMVIRLTADDTDAIDTDIRIEGTAPFEPLPPDYVGGPAPFKPHEPPEAETNRFASSHRWMSSVGEDGDILLSGRNSDHNGVAGALNFTSRVRVLAEGGTRRIDGDAIVIRGARAVTILLAGATSYVGPKDTGGNPAAATRNVIEAAARKPFDTLRSAHVAAHQTLFRRVSIALGNAPAPDMPTGARIGNSLKTFDPDLAALYFQFGRYLLISSSRPGSQPANLQGIWNDQLNPPWGSKWTININAEMNYWPAEPTALPECAEPLFDLIEELAVTGAATARTCYGARGWVAHHNTDIWRAAAPCDGAEWGLWPSGAAWLCLHLWDRYDYGRDRAFLKRAYPLMKGAALFFVDTLVVEPDHGWLVTNPSMSPENTHPEGAVLCAGPTMDAQIIRDLFTNTIAAAELLDVDADLRAELADKRARLVPNQIGEAGQLQEWMKDWDLLAPEINHRHVAHLYGLHPSNQIDAVRTPELHAAAQRSLEIRGDEATGWGIAWRLLFWARLGDGDHAYRVLRSLLGPDRTYPNMFDAHPPFQIDGNFGGAAGIAELFLQSVGDEIRLLPALPGAWDEGSISGLRARGGFEVDVAWASGRLSEAAVRAPQGGSCAVRYDGQVLRLGVEPGETVTLGLMDNRLSVR